MPNEISKDKALILAAATAWPFIFFLLESVMELGGLIETTSPNPPPAVFLLFGLMCSVPFVVIGLLLFYLAFIISKEDWPLDRKLFWGGTLVAGHVVAMPVFWFRHIWRPRDVTALPAPARFSMVLFGPLLLGLIPSLWYNLPVSLLAGVDMRDLLWTVGPIVWAGTVYLIGRWSYGWAHSPTFDVKRWAVQWSLFTFFSLPVVWYWTVFLSIFPLDPPPSYIYTLTAGAAVLALFAQPLVIGWIYLSNRLLGRMSAQLADDERGGRAARNGQPKA